MGTAENNAKPKVFFNYTVINIHYHKLVHIAHEFDVAFKKAFSQASFLFSCVENKIYKREERAG